MRADAVGLLVGAAILSATMPALAQQTIKIGELNSYKSPAGFSRAIQEGLADGD